MMTQKGNCFKQGFTQSYLNLLAQGFIITLSSTSGSGVKGALSNTSSLSNFRETGGEDSLKELKVQSLRNLILDRIKA